MIIHDIFDWLYTQDQQRASKEVDGLFFVASDIGSTRKENQDRVAVLRVASKAANFWCACLCDGMGGMANGRQAASFAISAFFASLISNRREPTEARLERAVRAANAMVVSEVPGGGSTLSALCLEAGSVFTLNVGDSRIFRMHRDGKLERLTTDDTMEEAYGSEGRGLLQFIGMKSGMLPHIKRVTGIDGQFFITSDGAHLVGDATLRDLRQNSRDRAVFSDRVLELSNWLGGVDNATIVATDWLQPEDTYASSQASDVSVWSTNGRLKLTWTTPPQADGIAQENDRERSPPEAEPRPQQADKPATPSHTAQNQPVKPGEKLSDGQKSPTPKRRSRKQKKEQIEIGFSEEEQGE
ncbi:protein phosphatase 2C domain-containing protein [Rhizobium sp. CNPSo 4062]|uniref:PP2C family protein-serine/threonine phosphatase n=1 Tax=Rhizobium sp. CNPSo 4062 TaxID=3021410 RepID=UPI002551B4C5|nr:protein phosphatase 2C domain-containing protein [Rhizobium sp. CNPSo 4062]MDK4706358.1 protein phosphatase 2C domain-containing protein [Rhizobium sp. CNPSo 4062]